MGITTVMPASWCLFFVYRNWLQVIAESSTLDLILWHEYIYMYIEYLLLSAFGF